MEVFPPHVRAELWADGTQPHRVRLDLPRPGLRGLQLLDLATYLPGALLPKADLASMAHSLELRSPLLDPAVVELGLGLPDRLKLRGREGKVALKRAFRDVLPPEVTSRGKSGFGVPLGRWFRSDLRELARGVLLDERARDRGWFRADTVQRLLDEHDAGRADHGHRLWCLLMLELWLRTHVEQRAAVLL
jgi:asparagine synthase (glutamine-hydrolysing)